MRSFLTEWGPHAKLWLPVLTALGTMVAAVVAAFWAIFLYFRQQRENAHARLLEAQKPFLELQLRLYVEAAKKTGELVNLKYKSERWEAAKIRFLELYWSELSMVEDKAVEVAMINFRDALKAFEMAPTNEVAKSRLENMTYDLAHAIRDSIQAAWGNSLKIPRVLLQEAKTNARGAESPKTV